MPQTGSVQIEHYFLNDTDAPQERHERLQLFGISQMLVDYINKLSNALQTDTVQCVFTSYISAVQQLKNHIDSENPESVQILKRLNGFKESLPLWFGQRLLNSKVTCGSLSQSQIDAIIHHGLDQLLTANASELELQMRTQQSFDEALLQFKSMLANAGLGTRSELEKLPIAKEVHRINPVNLSALIIPIITKLTTSQNISWIFYRLLHTELFLRLPTQYKNWEKNLRNYQVITSHQKSQLRHDSIHSQS